MVEVRFAVTTSIDPKFSCTIYVQYREKEGEKRTKLIENNERVYRNCMSKREDFAASWQTNFCSNTECCYLGKGCNCPVCVCYMFSLLL